jgi:hypothetical protein
MLPLCLLVLSVGLKFVETRRMSSAFENTMIRYRQFIFNEEMTELVPTALFI